MSQHWNWNIAQKIPHKSTEDKATCFSHDQNRYALTFGFWNVPNLWRGAAAVTVLEKSSLCTISLYIWQNDISWRSHTVCENLWKSSTAVCVCGLVSGWTAQRSLTSRSTGGWKRRRPQQPGQASRQQQKEKSSFHTQPGSTAHKESAALKQCALDLSPAYDRVREHIVQVRFDCESTIFPPLALSLIAIIDRVIHLFSNLFYDLIP